MHTYLTRSPDKNPLHLMIHHQRYQKFLPSLLLATQRFLSALRTYHFPSVSCTSLSSDDQEACRTLPSSLHFQRESYELYAIWVQVLRGIAAK